jgi:hypothetical protein
VRRIEYYCGLIEPREWITFGENSSRGSEGHKSSKTTKIYTHVTEKSLQKISSPFDSL